MEPEMEATDTVSHAELLRRIFATIRISVWPLNDTTVDLGQLILMLRIWLIVKVSF
jgi:hypothetical protein